MKKKLLAWMLSVSMCMGMVIPVFAQEATLIDGGVYETTMEETEDDAVVAMEQTSEVNVESESTPSKGGDSFGTAYEMPVNEFFEDHLIKYSEESYYKIVIPENGYIEFITMNNKKSEGAWYFSMYNDERENLMGWVVEAGKLDKQKSGFLGIEAGTYYVKGETARGTLGSYRWTDGDFNMKCSFTATEYRELEPNSNYDTANTVVTDVEYHGEATGGDIDYFSFVAPQGGNYQIDFTIENWYFIAELFDDSDAHTKIGGFRNYGSNTLSWKNIKLEGGKKYYLVMRGDDQAFHYTFKITYKHEHTYTSAVTKKTSYGAAGVTTYTCDCGDSYQVAIPKLTLQANAMSSVTNKAKKQMKIAWTKNNAATGYLVQYSTNKSFAKSVKTIDIKNNRTISKTVKKLAKGKEYYVRVCSYVTEGGIKYYSAWSAPKRVKIKK